MTISYTPRLHLSVPDFLTEPWHSEFAAAMNSIDQILFNAVLAQQATLWVAAHAYVIGDLVISPDTGVMYSCAIPHTSVGPTFTNDLTNFPTFWTPFGPILATQPEAEAGVENTKYMSALRTKQAIAALGSATSLSNPRSGLLEWVSTTSLQFKPKNGDKLKINGLLQPIPSAGIPGLANTTGVFVNGLTGNLAPSTTYLVCAFMSAGLMTADFRTGGAHSPSVATGNVGIEILTGDDTRTLIGIVRTDASTHFVDSNTQRFVRSWYNSPSAPLLNFTTAVVTTTSSSTAYAELSTPLRVEWVNFAGESIWLDFSAASYNLTGGAATEISFGLDSTTVPQDAWCFASAVTAGSLPANLAIPLQPSEGYHFATVLGRCQGGQGGLWFTGNAPGTRPTFRGLIPPRG